jgi:hypothetical protein
MNISVKLLWDFVKALIVLKLVVEAYHAIKESIKGDLQNANDSGIKLQRWWNQLNSQRKQGAGLVKWLAETTYLLLTSIESFLVLLSLLDEVIIKFLQRLFTLTSTLIKSAYSILISFFTLPLSFIKGMLYFFCFSLTIGVLILYIFSPLIMYNLSNPFQENVLGQLLQVRFPPMQISDVSPKIDSTATILLGIVISLGLFTLISEVKVLDIIELKRNVSNFKEEVNEKFGHVTSTLNTIVNTQNLLQTSQQMQVTHNVYLDTGLQVITDLQEKVNRKLDISQEAIADVRIDDLPNPLNPVEGVNSLFKLRFLVEQKLKNLAKISEIPITLDALTLVQELRNRGLQRDLARSVENIVRITDEVARGIQLTLQQIDIILAVGATTLAAIDKTQTYWERSNPQNTETSHK